ncbi:hypothetical protein [Proteus terrae]|uniref:hypothetical protein n=1 Tax=Proteus terrae TaxID=1574161 RepID=UPI001C5DCF0D|nr:hypothetical protein [Proteus terrae]
MTNEEMILQTGIIEAMSKYSAKVDIEYTPIQFYNNQQGETRNKIMADFVFTVDNSRVFMAEVKCLEILSNTLHTFDVAQYSNYLTFEKYHFPIYYVYNNKKYLTNHLPSDNALVKNLSIKDKAQKTLEDCNYSRPSLLKGANPLVEEHGNLLEFFDENSILYNDFTVENVGAIIRTVGSTAFNRNSIFTAILGSNGKLIAGILDVGTASNICNMIYRMKENKELTQKERDLLDDFTKGSQWAKDFLSKKNISIIDIENPDHRSEKTDKPKP